MEDFFVGVDSFREDAKIAALFQKKIGEQELGELERFIKGFQEKGAEFTTMEHFLTLKQLL